MEKKIYGVVYGLIDGTNDFEYIGQTTRSVELRFKEHAKDPYYIGNAIRDHGADMFVIVILKVCYSKAELDFWEKHFIKSRNTIAPNGYNLTEGGKGVIPCNETRAKIGTGNRGKKRTPEQNARNSIVHRGQKNHNYGVPMSNEQRAKISATKRGETLFQNLVVAMETHQLSYKSLAKLLGVSDVTVSRKMRGERNFMVHEWFKLSEIFGLPIEILMSCDDERVFSNFKRYNTSFKNLLSLMVEHQLSYSDLDKLLGLSQASVSKKMRGERNFTAKDIAKLVEIFGKPADYLMKRDDTE